VATTSTQQPVAGTTITEKTIHRLFAAGRSEPRRTSALHWNLRLACARLHERVPTENDQTRRLSPTQEHRENHQSSALSAIRHTHAIMRARETK